MVWKRGEVASSSFWGWGLGGQGWGWDRGGVFLDWMGLVLSGHTRSPARPVYLSTALVTSLRGQQCHFAALLIIKVIIDRQVISLTST